jgi:carbon-monoxide dehydrogenase large subunit
MSSPAEPFRARHVGTPVERVEDLRLLRGRGQYVDDLHREGMLHAAILRSTVAHGRLVAIHAEAARKLPGVRAVYTAADVAQAFGGSIPTIPMGFAAMEGMEAFEQPVIAHDKVRHVGEALAIVIADSAALAEDALDALVADIEDLPPVMDPAGNGDPVLLFERHGSNLATTYTALKGDAHAAMAGAAYRRKESFRIHRHTAVAMEPRGLLADWDGANTKLTLIGAAKAPFQTKRMLGRRMDLPDECIDVFEPSIGGSFGVRGEFYPEDYLVPFAARKLGRPVKWVEDRRENLLATSQAREIDCELEIGCARDGTILALIGHARVDVGAYLRMSVAVQPRNVAQFMAGPYRVANVHVQSSVLVSNKAPSAAYRGPGRFEADFFRERLFDLVAADLGLDRVEFRRRNLVASHEMPYPVATVTPAERKDDFDSGDYQVTLDRCLKEIRWQEKSALQGKLVDGNYHGLGVGCFIEGGAAGPREHARLAVEPDGTVCAYVGSTNLGQGLETVCVQIAADALRVPMERIRIFHGSTTYLSDGFGSYHSRSVVMGGSAILAAAMKLKDEIRERAARRLGCEPAQVDIGEDLSISAQGRSVDLRELVGDGLSVEGVFANHHHTYAYGAAAAHVAVNARTGQVTVLDYVTVADLGRIINPLTAKGQAVGAVVQGLGGVLLEELVYDAHGHFLTASLADYLLPTATDFPNIRAFILENSPSPNNPLGAKGGGEGSIIPVGGVIANAVASALGPMGAGLRDLPLSSFNVWKLLHAQP